MRSALVLVDLQRDFLESAGMHPHRDQVVGGAARWLNHFRSIGMPVFHVWTSVQADLSDAMPHWKASGRSQCVWGTPGHGVPDALIPAEGEIVLHKTGFSPYADGTLQFELKRLGADTLVVAGVHLHACVRQTALEAHQHGLRVLIARDSVGSNDPLHAAITARYLRERLMPAVTLEAFEKQNKDGWMLGAEQPTIQERIHSCVSRAPTAVLSWKRCSVAQRLELLEPLASLIRRDHRIMAELITVQTGKPIRFSNSEVTQSADLAEAVFAEARKWVQFQRIDENAGIRHCAIGVVAAITPWNNPLYIPLGKLLPALCCGNAVVWKGAEESAKVSELLLQWLSSLGLPDGLVTLVQGGIDASCALMNHPTVGAVTLTGSMDAGYAAKEICGNRSIPLQAELGGNNAALVWSDADLELAATQIAAGAFEMAGQRCTANRRVILHRCIANAFLEKLKAEVRALKWGHPMDPLTRIGPLVSERRANAVKHVIGRCEDLGLHVSYPQGKEIPNDPLAWVSPVIIVGAPADSEVVQEESFGPVLVVQVAQDWEEALALCNGVKQGLVASLFSQSLELQQQFLHEAQAGIVKINQTTAGASTGAAFGGWKASGIGPPEHGVFDFQFFARPQTVYGAQ